MPNKLLSEGRPWDCSNAEPGGNLPGHLKIDPILHRGETEAKFLFAFGHEVFSLSLPPAHVTTHREVYTYRGLKCLWSQSKRSLVISGSFHIFSVAADERGLMPEGDPRILHNSEQ